MFESVETFKVLFVCVFQKGERYQLVVFSVLKPTIIQQFFEMLENDGWGEVQLNSPTLQRAVQERRRRLEFILQILK